VPSKTLIPTAAAVVATGVVGGLASRPARTEWFKKLRKPPYQPAPQVFPIAWNALYSTIAGVSASTIDEFERQGRTEDKRRYIAALGANLVLNAGWSWLFFSQRRLGTAAVAAGVLAASSADLTRRSVSARGKAAAPLAAYPLWCAFATVLSSHIWFLNRR
jgi:benzodiazapine receptor